jgi:hypothetical protein
MPAERIYRNTCNEELANLNRDVAPQALWPNSLFSKVVFS